MSEIHFVCQKRACILSRNGKWWVYKWSFMWMKDRKLHNIMIPYFITPSFLSKEQRESLNRVVNTVLNQE